MCSSRRLFLSDPRMRSIDLYTLLLKVGQDKFKCVAFKNVADVILKCSDGDQVGAKLNFELQIF